MIVDPLLGDIALFSFDFVPSFWLACEGQILQIASYQPLFTVIGTTFGGNGSTTFALPDLRKSVPIPGMHYCIAYQGIYPERN